MKKKLTKLTTRQHRLADLIESGNGKRFSKRDIYEAVPGYEWHEDASDKCPAIRTDMKIINASSERDAIIVFDHQEYYYTFLAFEAKLPFAPSQVLYRQHPIEVPIIWYILCRDS